MDLKNYLRSPEQVKPDFGWWMDAESFDIDKNQRNPHECKDELALQWGNDGFVIQTDDNNVAVMRESRKASVQNAFVMQARSMLNAGVAANDIRAYFAKHQKPEQVKACSTEIERQLKLAGSVGRFVLDARGYRDCSEALRFASKNPFRKYMKYMIGCTCGNHTKMKKITATAFTSTGDPIQDMLENNQQLDSEEVDVCPRTGFQLMSGEGDIDASWAGDTMIDVMNACDLNQDSGKKFTASKDKPYMRLKKFFIAFDEGQIPKSTEEFDTNAQTQDMNPQPLSFKVQKDNNEVKNVDIQNKDSVKFNLNPDIVVDKPLTIERGSELQVPEFDKPVEIIEIENPAQTTNTFGLKDDYVQEELPMSCEESPVIVELSENEDQEIQFGDNDNDSFFKDDRELILDDKQEDKEKPMLFAF